MKRSVRVLALLLCAAMLLSMIGCGAAPVATEAPTSAPTEAPTEPPATEPDAEYLFAQACDILAGAETITMQIESEKTISVAGSVLKEETEQILTRSGDSFHSLSEVSYNGIDYIYEELYLGGTLYTSVDDSYHFRSGESSLSLIAGQYPPSLPIDGSLYGSITGSGSAIEFAQPSSAESWAVPEGSHLVEASASAALDSDGALKSVSYCVTYTYGPSEVTHDVEIEYMEAAAIPEPDSAVEYRELDNAHLPRVAVQAFEYLLQCSDVTTTTQESIMSQAAATMRNETLNMDFSRTRVDLSAKIDSSLSYLDFTTNESDSFKMEEIYHGGKYTYSEDGGEPTSTEGVTKLMILDYCQNNMLSNFVYLDYWESAKYSDLGSTILIELDYLDSFGDVAQARICDDFWGDGNYLNNLASATSVMGVNGYLAVDKHTGLPTAAGYTYAGTHTIDQIYALTCQTDQNIYAPALNALYNISDEMPPEEEPKTKATPLLYHVTGDAGQEMWLFGTIHIGDERTAYLPQELYDAFASSDALALEFYSEAFEEKLENDEKLQEEVSALYFFSDGTTVKDHLDEELYEEALRYLKASGGYSMNAPYMKPSLWTQTIENFYLRQTYSLITEKGCESRLEKLAKDQNKEIRDVESGLSQIKMSTNWSDELQELMLKDAINYSLMEYQGSTTELYEMWCAGDEAALREAISDEVDTSELTDEELAEYEAQKHLLEEYNKGMSYDRNEGMLKVAKKYLESGDVVFFAVGLAHLLNNVNGLVDTLRDAGYTVELVTYS